MWRWNGKVRTIVRFDVEFNHEPCSSRRRSTGLKVSSPVLQYVTEVVLQYSL